MASIITNSDKRCAFKRLAQVRPTMRFYRFLVALLCLLLLLSFVSSARALEVTTQDLDRDAIHALKRLYRTSQRASEMSQSALAILIFPSMSKDDAAPGGSWGKGVMMKHGGVIDHYHSTAVNWDVTEDALSYSYVVFLMTEVATSYANGLAAWEKGSGPAIVVVQEKSNRDLPNPPQQGDAYAFVFGPQGLIPQASIEGTKITKIKR